MTFADSFFGTTLDYADDFEAAFSLQPTYVAAGASAVSYSLADAIQNAFTNCRGLQGLDVETLLYDPSAVECVDSDGKPLENTTTGYQLVLQSLASSSLMTFFGSIEFNSFRFVLLNNVSIEAVRNLCESCWNA